MNNYDEIAREAIRNIVHTDNLIRFISMNQTVYCCALEAAKLQAERFNKDLDDSYIESLSKEELN